MLQGPQSGIVYTLLGIMAVGSLIALFVVPPFLDRIDRTGKVGILGF